MIRFLMVAAVLLAAATPPAHAQDRIVEPNSIEAIVALMHEAGYKAEVKTQDNGERYIESGANGGVFSIYLYGCKNKSGCDSFEFYSYYKKKPHYTAELANDWNAKKRFLKVVIDKDGDLAEYLYVSSLGKMTYANFVDYIDWYTAMDSDLSQFLQSKEPAKK